MARKLLLVAGVLAALLVAAGGAAALWLKSRLAALEAPAVAEPQILMVEKGMTYGRLSKRLAEAGLVQDTRDLRLYARLHPEVTKLKAGEYALAQGDSVARILDRIARGEVVQHAVTIPEGWSLKEIAPVVEAAGVASAAEFLALATDATFAAKLKVPAGTLEGYLFPDTYQFTRGAGAAAVASAMVQRFKSRLPADYEARAAAVGLTAHQAVILASVVEKETGAASERKLISAVFHNRLKKKMRLQSDPTVIYGIPNYDGNIRKKDLLTVTPYNTYRINGLPAGPIANPGYEALMAVVDPAPAEFLYFVSRNDGSHHFSATLKEHNQAVDFYQRRRGTAPGTPAAASR